MKPARPQAFVLPNSPIRLVLQVVVPKRRLLSAPFTQALVVGRAEEGAAAQPDIDMTPAGAVEAGVSRFHARFELRQDTLYVEDLGSTNGTRINGVDLVAGKSYRLMPGDEIEMGSLRLNARVVR